MSRFGDSANGPSVLDISNISGVSADIDTLADHATAISNLGPVATEISNLGTTAVIADMSALGTQAVRDDMDALADVTTELGVLGNTTTAGYIAAIGTSTVGATSQLTVDALGQLTSEISLLASNIQTLQNSANNSPIQLGNLSDVDFTSNSPSLGDTIVFTSNNKFEAQALPGAGPLSGTNLTETSPAVDQILKISAVNAGVPEYVNTTVSALVYDAGFGNLAEVAAATPAAAGEVVHYDGTSAWTVGQLDYSEITGTPSLQALATSANFADLTEAGASGTAGDVIHWNGTLWEQGQLASTELSDTASLVRNNANSTLTGDYTIDGNLDVTNGEIRVDTIDPDPHGVNDASGPGTLTILGNLQVDGTTTTINSATLTVNDKSVTLSKPASGNTTFSAMNGAGIDVDTTGMSAVWTTNVPAITYSTNSSGNTADAQTWDINRGVVAKGWSDGTNSYDGQLTLNCSANSHGITVKSAPHSDNATYDLVLPATITGAGGKVLAQNSGNTQLEFIDVVKPNTSVTLNEITSTGGYFVGGSDVYLYEPTTGEFMARVGTTGAYRYIRLGNGSGEIGNTSSATSIIAGGTGASVSLATDGKLTLSDYTGAGTHTGTAAKSLAVDSSGNVIEEPLGATVGVAAAMAIVF